MNAVHIVGNAVGTVLVGADIDADQRSARAGLEPRQRRAMTLVVEAEAVDDGLVLDQPENARLVVAGLRFRRDGADFGETKTDLQERFRHLGVLVIAGRHADRVWELDAGDRLGKPLVGLGRTAGHEPGL
ncbi:hypothetical protein D9M70_425840 [compost metagenome]